MTPEQVATRSNVIWGVGLVLLFAHVIVAWRWWSIRQLARVTPVTGTIRSIRDVTNPDGMGSRKVMTFEYTPMTPRGLGERRTGSAPVRTIARFETVVGQKIAVHVDPADPTRLLVPESGNPWVPQLVGLVLVDITIALLFATDSLG